MSCYLLDNLTGVQTSVPCNSRPGSRNLFSGIVQFESYGYLLTPWVTYTFLVLFSVSAVVHISLSTWRRSWWLLATVSVGCSVEVIGVSRRPKHADVQWAGRLWSLQSTEWSPNNGGYWTSNFNGFIVQTVCLVIAPTFFSAANYVLLGRLIDVTNTGYSSLHPTSLRILFITADFLCLIIQGIGGGLAGTAANTKGANQGAYIMTGGVITQLVVTGVYCAIFAEWTYRRHTRRTVQKQYKPLVRSPRTVIPMFMSGGNTSPGSPASSRQAGNESTESSGSNCRIDTMIFLITFSTLLIVVRSVYRSVELTDGWAGPIATNQTLFLCLDALLMVSQSWSGLIVSSSLSFLMRYFIPEWQSDEANLYSGNAGEGQGRRGGR